MCAGEKRTEVPEKHEAEIRVTAPQGITWTRQSGETSTGTQLLQALADLRGIHGDVAPRQWNWWQEGRGGQEHDRLWLILNEWDNDARHRELHGRTASCSPLPSHLYSSVNRRHSVV